MSKNKPAYEKPEAYETGSATPFETALSRYSDEDRSFVDELIERAKAKPRSQDVTLADDDD